MRADRLLQYVQDNKYIDSSIQKGGLPEISGCLEHTAILSQLIREAKADKKNLVITWLDVANAYESIPHNLIQTALQRAHVPEDVCDLVKDYYSKARIRFTTNRFTTRVARSGERDHNRMHPKCNSLCTYHDHVSNVSQK